MAMNESLKSVLDAYLSPSKDVSLKTALSDVKNLNELIEAAKSHSEELIEQFNSLSDAAAKKEAADTIKALNAVMKTAVTEHNKQLAEAEVAASVDEAFNELKGLKLAEPKKVEKPSVEEIAKADGKTDAPPAPEAKQEVAPEPVKETLTPAAPVAEVAPAEPVAQPQAELVGAGAGQFSAAGLPQGTLPPAFTRPSGEYSSVFAVDTNGSPTGNQLRSAKEVVSALSDTYRRYKSHVRGNGVWHRVASYQRPEVEEFSVYGNRDKDQETIDRVASTPLQWDAAKGQFAAGWCAPEETLYELCPQISSGDGLVDLPTVTARRGSLQYTKAPNFADLYADAAIGQILTETQVEGETVKQCIEIDCPDFTSVTLDVNPLCITGNLLTHAGYPEYEQRFIAEAITANLHKINANIIGRMVTASDTATVAVGTGPTDTSSASQFLDYVSLYATWLRQQHRTVLNQVVEVVAPQWYRQHAAADLSRRTGVDMLTAQSRFDEALRERFIRIQWVHDWQLLSSTLATVANTRQATIQVLIYLPGTFVKAVNPVINLGVLHSAAQLSLNQYTAMFVEEGFAVIERCYQSLAITIPICPSGTTGAASGSCDVTP